METAQHTPGPWKLGPADNDSQLTILGPRDGCSHEVIARMPGEYRRNHAVWPKVEANARLIAAAPELLRICDIVGEWVTRDHADRMNGRMRGDLANWVLDDLRAAVAKAKG